jgi:hypothetical protein
MRRPVLLIAAVSALVLAGTAVAGGWATVKLSSRPTGLAPEGGATRSTTDSRSTAVRKRTGSPPSRSHAGT